jgi:hypothetical protein
MISSVIFYQIESGNSNGDTVRRPRFDSRVVVIGHEEIRNPRLFDKRHDQATPDDTPAQSRGREFFP